MLNGINYKLINICISIVVNLSNRLWFTEMTIYTMLKALNVVKKF